MNLSQITHCSVKKAQVIQPMALKALNVSHSTVLSRVQTNPSLIFRVKMGSFNLPSLLSVFSPLGVSFGCWEGTPALCLLPTLGLPTSPTPALHPVPGNSLHGSCVEAPAGFCLGLG